MALTRPEVITGLSTSADQGAFRIIQESLTNAARHGIAGMRERARLLGGSLIAEDADGEFRVELRLPRRGAQP